MFKIEKAICLHHTNRAAPIEILKKEIEDRGIDYQLFVASNTPKKIINVDYIDIPNPDIVNWRHGVHKNRHYNAFCCHKEMIKIAIQQNKQNILMLEDDAYITSRFDVVLSNLLQELNSLKWDIIHLGWWMGNDEDEFNNKLESEYNNDKWIGIGRTQKIGGLHGALINNSIYELILNMSPIDPIDCQLNQLYPYINGFYIFPKIIHVKNIPSNCDGNFIIRKQI